MLPVLSQCSFNACCPFLIFSLDCWVMTLDIDDIRLILWLFTVYYFWVWLISILLFQPLDVSVYYLSTNYIPEWWIQILNQFRIKNDEYELMYFIIESCGVWMMYVSIWISVFYYLIQLCMDQCIHAFFIECGLWIYI